MEVLQILVRNMEIKKDIRKRVLSMRSNMPVQEWWEKSLMISEKIVSHPFFLEADEIYCYMDYRREVCTRPIFEKAWELGKKTAAPKISGEEMEFFYIQSFADVKEGAFHIPEPVTSEAAQGNHVLVILPGVAFDRKRNRLGYGKGFYDRYLSRHQNYKVLAPAFELQIVDAIPVEEHDIRPEIIITEEKRYV